MVKRGSRLASHICASSILAVGALGACAVTPEAPGPQQGQVPPEALVPGKLGAATLRKDLGPTPRRLWSRKLAGFITDLDVSRDGSAILISSAPNREVEGGSRSYLLASFDARGRMKWQNEPKAPIKAQAISDDGTLAIIATYNGTITAINPRAPKYRELWVAEASCRPYVMSQARKIVCYNDDDEEAGIAFQVFDWNGKKLSSYPVSQDVLAFAISEDERNVAVALNRGQVILFNAELRPLWQKKVEGEISALAVSSGSAGSGPSTTQEPMVAVVFNESGNPRQKLALLGPKGERVGKSLELRDRLVHLGFRPGQEGWLYGFGQAPREQFYVAYRYSLSKHAASGGELKQQWREAEPRSADCPSLYALSTRGPVLGRESLTENMPRHPELALYDEGGDKVAELPVGGEEGACLYVHSVSHGSGVILVGMDDGTFSAFSLGFAH